jgi:hypothetical protein
MKHLPGLSLAVSLQTTTLAPRATYFTTLLLYLYHKHTSFFLHPSHPVSFNPQQCCDTILAVLRHW